MAIEIIGSITVNSDVSPEANSYVSLVEAKYYWELDPYKKSYAYTNDQIARALISSTNSIDYFYQGTFKGDIFDPTIPLFFPRKNIKDARGVEIKDMTVYPKDIKRATAIQAYYSLEFDRNEEASISAVKSQKMDGLGSQEFFSPSIQASAKKPLIHEEAQSIMQPYVSFSKYSVMIGRG
jgi:hypothetical protein